ncbi:MAG: response regulator [Polyangiaceae bacterium]
MPETESTLILLVDADAHAAEAVTAALVREGEVVVARTAAQAVRVAGKRQPAVVLIDDSLPDATPEELLADLRVGAPRLRAAVFTRSRDPGHTSKLSQVGHLVRKPIDAGALRTAVKALLRLHNMAAGVARMKTGEVAMDDSRRRTTMRRERVTLDGTPSVSVTPAAPPTPDPADPKE